MKVRLACVDDLNEIMELYHLVSDMMEDSAYDIGWRKEVYPTKEIVLLDIEQQTLYVLEKNEKIIGAIVLNHEYEECYQNIYWQIYAEDEEVTIIHRFCIHPDYRGCGKYLLKQIIKIAKKDGQKSIRLDVLSSNKPAICLYEKCSFLLQGHQIMDYGKLVIASLYEKII